MPRPLAGFDPEDDLGYRAAAGEQPGPHRLALRTQQILARESGVAQTVDPLAGSYYLESLTTSIEQEARSYLERIDALGGVVAAIERGWVRGRWKMPLIATSGPSMPKKPS